MASWSIFANALALNPSVGQAESSEASTDVYKLFDANQVSKYATDDINDLYFSIDLLETKTIAGHLLGNISPSFENATLRIVNAAFLGQTSNITNQNEFTLTDDPDQLFVADNVTSARYVTYVFPGAASVAGSLGSIEIFGTRIDLTGAEPRLPADHELELGHAVLDTPGGGEVMQIVGGQRNALTLAFDKVDTGSGSLSETIETSLRDTSSWANGIAVTDYNWGPNQGPALYGRPMPGSSIRRPWSDSMGRKTYTLQFREFSKGVAG